MVLKRVNGSMECFGGRAKGLVNGASLEDNEMKGTQG